MDTVPPSRRWRERLPVRLSLRALMAFVLISAVGLGWVVRRAHIQRDAVAAIERAGGTAHYNWQVTTTSTADYEDLKFNPSGLPRWPKWLIDGIGPDFFGTIKLVVVPGLADPVMAQVGRLTQLEELDFMPSRKVAGYGPTDAGMAHLRGLTRLKHLTLGVTTKDGVIGSKITGRGLAAISSATRLQILQLQGVPLSDPDLAALHDLTDLRILEMGSPDVTDAGLDHLTGLVEMRQLSLQGTRVTSAGIVHLRGMTRLKQLNLALTLVDRLETCRPLASLDTLVLSRTPIDDAGLASASDPGFAGLTGLILFNTRVGDAGLTHLKDLPKLKRLNLIGTDVTDAGVAEFKRAQPNTSVVYRATPAKSPPGPVGR